MLLGDPVHELLGGGNFCVAGTLAPDGSPRLRPLWIDTDGEFVLLNGTLHRSWVRQLGRDPRVSCVVWNRDDPYEYAQIRGRLAGLTEAGADEHAARLGDRYGFDAYPRPGDQRVILRIAAEHVVHRSG